MTVHLHTTLQQPASQGRLRAVQLSLPDGARVGDALRSLDITMDPGALILVIDHRVVDVDTGLVDGSRLDIIPAISGG